MGLDAPFQPDVFLAVWGALTGNQSADPRSALVKRLILLEQSILSRSNQHSDETKKLVICKFGRRLSVDTATCLEKAGYPSIRPTPNFHGIQPKCGYLFLVELVLQAKSKPRLAYFSDTGTKLFKPKPLGERLRNRCQPSTIGGKINPSMLPKTGVLN